MIVPTPFRRLTGVVLGAATLLLPASLAAQGAAPDNAQISTYLPSAHELSRLSTSGSYLAARHAGTNRDAGVCVHFREPVPSPLRKKGHSALTVTVADPDALVARLESPPHEA